jgi:hypothetical protein
VRWSFVNVIKGETNGRKQMKNEQSQIQQPSLLSEMKILRLATLLSEGD